MKAGLSWSVLGGLLLATLLGAATFDRRQWPGLVGDEATYLMLGESLAWDLDLVYSRADYDRFVAHWGRKPEGLILQSSDRGRTLTYGKPAFYSLYLAPWLRLSPTRGASLANAAALILAAVAAVLVLRKSLGDGAALWVAAFVFASVAFAYVLWAHADLFLMCLSALALALAYGGGSQRGRLAEIYVDATSEPLPRYAARWAAAGALLAAVALSRPFYATLLLPAALAVPERRRTAGLASLAAGAAGLALVTVIGSFAVHGSWTSYGGERLGFYSFTGFPQVDFPEGGWAAEVKRRGGPGSWVADDRLLPYDFEPRLTAWNVAYLLAGRHVGLLPSFLPLILGLLGYRRTAGRWALPVAVAASLACFLYVRPFNFYGGGAALANRYFLPLYPAFWFAIDRPRRLGWPLATALAAAPFLWPLWSAPRASPYTAEGAYRTVGPVARRWLPYETTQDHLKPSGHDDVVHNGLWIKPLGPEVEPTAAGAWFAAARGTTAELLVGSARPLDRLELEFAPQGPARIEVEGASLGATTLLPSGGTAFELTVDGPTARHRMWWGEEDWNLYRLRIRLPGASLSAAAPLRFRLRPVDE
jgi:hypothetical protein